MIPLSSDALSRAREIWLSAIKDTMCKSSSGLEMSNNIAGIDE